MRNSAKMRFRLFDGGSSWIFYGAIIVAFLLDVFDCVEFHIGFFYYKSDGTHFIQPGTKWCGNGDIAENHEDLGRFRQLDSCCRAHDTCKDQIASGLTRHGLTNDHRFFMSNCECDYAFHHCLKSVNASAEENEEVLFVGNEYFNIFYVQCFNYTHPATCVKNETRMEKFLIVPIYIEKCVEYEYNTSAPKQWQWMDVPFF